LSKPSTCRATNEHIVVNITADYTPKLQEGKSRKKSNDDDDQGDDDSSDLFRRFFGGPGGGDSSPQSQRREQSGTGFVVDKNGYIITNHHVVENASEITITLLDNRTFSAKVIGSDELEPTVTLPKSRVADPKPQCDGSSASPGTTVTSHVEFKPIRCWS
jgi:S1-C subfamily serine protease